MLLVVDYAISMMHVSLIIVSMCDTLPTKNTSTLKTFFKDTNNTSILRTFFKDFRLRNYSLKKLNTLIFNALNS